MNITLAKTNNTKKKNMKKWGARILVFVLAAMFVLTTFISVIPVLFG